MNKLIETWPHGQSRRYDHGILKFELFSANILGAFSAHF
jgi:hypothetical protein